MKRREIFFTMECQLINIVKMMEFKNHHIATIIALINSAKKHQWTLKLKCKKFHEPFNSFKVPHLKILIDYKGKKSNFLVEKPGSHDLSQR